MVAPYRESNEDDDEIRITERGVRELQAQYIRKLEQALRSNKCIPLLTIGMPSKYTVPPDLYFLTSTEDLEIVREYVASLLEELNRRLERGSDPLKEVT